MGRIYVLSLLVIALNAGKVFGQVPNLILLSETTESNGIVYWHGTPLTGKILDMRDPNDTKFYEADYLNGLPNGHKMKLYDSGKKQYEENYAKGIKNGEQTYWFENGTKQKKENFNHGKKNGNQSEWYEDGKLKYSINYSNDVPSDGQYLEYDSKGIKTVSGIYLKGKKIGVWNFYKDGEIFNQVNYDNVGYKVSEGNLNRGIKNNVWNYYFSNSSQVSKIENYSNGRLSGMVSQYYPEGKLKSQLNYVNDSLDGKAVYWGEDGQINNEEYYMHGKIDELSRARLRSYRKEDGKLFYCPSSLLKNSYVVISMEGNNNQNEENYDQEIYRQFFSAIQKNRGLSEFNSYNAENVSTDTISFKITLTTPEITIKQSSGTNLTGQNITGWTSTVGIKIRVQNMLNPSVSGYIYYYFLSFGGKLFPTQQDAFMNAIDNTGILKDVQNLEESVTKVITDLYPIKGTITKINEIDKKKGDAKSVTVDFGRLNLDSKAKWYAFDASAISVNWKNTSYIDSNIGELTPKGQTSSGYTFKVKSNGDKLAEALKQGKEIIVISVIPLGKNIIN